MSISLDRRRFGALSVALAACGPAIGQTPARREIVKLLVPFPPGGTTDFVARVLADQLRGDMANALIVENKPGAAGRLAIAALKQAPADGTTLMVHGMGIQSLYPHTLKQPGYEPFADVTPISTTNRVETVFAVGPAVPDPVRTIKEYLAWVRGDAKRGMFADGGSGTPGHFLGVTLGEKAQVELTPVHYRSSTVAFPDVIGGVVPAVATHLNDAVAHRGGKLRILATTGEKPSPFAPDVPTFAEQGFPEFLNSDFFAVFVHGNTPVALQESLSNAIRRALAAPEVVASLREAFIEPFGMTPAEVQRVARADYERFGRIVKALRFQPE